MTKNEFGEKYDYRAQLNRFNRFNYEIYGEPGDQYALVKKGSEYGVRKGGGWRINRDVLLKVGEDYLTEKSKAEKRAKISFKFLLGHLGVVAGLSALAAVLLPSTIAIGGIAALMGFVLVSQFGRFNDILVSKKFTKIFLQSELAFNFNSSSKVFLPVCDDMIDLKVPKPESEIWSDKEIRPKVIEFMKEINRFEQLLKLSYEYASLTEWKKEFNKAFDINRNSILKNKDFLDDVDRKRELVDERIIEIRKVYEGWAQEYYDSHNNDKSTALMQLLSKVDTEFNLEGKKKLKDEVKNESLDQEQDNEFEEASAIRYKLVNSRYAS